MSILTINNSSKHVEVSTFTDLFTGNGVAACFQIGYTAHVVDEDSTWICQLDASGSHFWALLESNFYNETRLTWTQSAEPLIVGNVASGSMRSRYPILPTRSFSSVQSICRSTLELDVGGVGSFVELDYGTDYGLLPRTPQVIGAPGIGIGFGLQSIPHGAGGPRTAIADQAVGFAVTAAIASTLTTSSVFRFSWVERTLKVAAVGAKAGVLEPTAGFTNQPTFSLPYAVAHTSDFAAFPLMPARYAPGQFAVFFNRIDGMQVEIWRRPHRTKAGSYRDGSLQQKGLRRLSTGLTLLDRIAPNVFYGTALDVFTGYFSHIEEFHWCYWSDKLQARSALCDLPIFRAGNRPLRTNTGQIIFRSGNVFWIGLR
jgi:hypothetical protein